ADQPTFGIPYVSPDGKCILCPAHPASAVWWTASAGDKGSGSHDKGSGSAPPRVQAPTGKNVEFATQLPRFLAVQVDPKAGMPFITLPDGAIRHYSYPDFQLQGEYRLPGDKVACHAALDAAKSLLYLAVAPIDKVKVPGNPDDRIDGEGDIIIIDVGRL